jgi:hypothetical protein
MTADDVTLEELRIRASLEKMDEAFCIAMLKAIGSGEERAPTAISTSAGTRNPNRFLSSVGVKWL